MNATWRNLDLAIPRAMLPTLTVTGVIKLLTILGASMSLALLTALAGNVLADGPGVLAQHGIVIPSPRANTLLLCTLEDDGLRCVEEVF